MPLFRPDIAALRPYEVGRPIEDVARERGIDPAEIVRLASNESPAGPFPGVAEAVARSLGSANRYPDPVAWDLGIELARQLGVEPANLAFGNGSVALLVDIANLIGGPGTSVVFGWPSFVMYRFAAIWAMMRPVEVLLDEGHRLDLSAMLDAMDDSTRLVFVCNPNNPTGTLRTADDVEEFVQAVPEDVLVVVDEAYHEFVTDEGHRSAVPLAVERPNVVVLRTFSKVYSLAAFRIGYGVAHEGTITELRKAQAPLTVNQPAQVAALASLGSPDELRRRVEANSSARHHVTGALAERGLDPVPSHTNFVYFHMGGDSRELADRFVGRGLILRPMSRGWMRVTLGDERENQRFLEGLDEVLAGSDPG